jgi:thiol-disulfide isomerase/thioredoxin
MRDRFKGGDVVLKDNEENYTGWMNHVLVDVHSGESFRIIDFNKPVLVETFAVWCPTCKRQQDEIKRLHDEIGDSVISVSLDVDPNENEVNVIGHLERYGYEWIFAVAPVEVSQDLVDNFGVGVVNAPSTPVILVCNGEARLLRTGVKSSEELIQEAETC